MVELTIDGHKVEMPEGSMVMHAVEKLSQYVPHFCYHKKLSIAANCRMCLVEVEKAPKPLPACATPVTQGMVVHTASAKAKAAQEGVMEFLLINHPLDCPICDQGGECQLQDLAVGYGKSESRYEEDKRVVEVKEAGPLISMEEMSRCIHCTRCVRFGQEVAGVMELGMLNRGEHAEITSFLGQSVDSELSGNMIDLCPVGALTSKPFRYQARTWELSRRKGISSHDSLGSHLTIQVKAGKVMRVLPLENEAINECWISDRDRFAYEGLNSTDRITTPMIKRDGQWHTSTWDEALKFAAGVLRQDAQNSAGLIHPMSTLEEMYGLQQLLSVVGSKQLGFNLNSNLALDQVRNGVPYLGMPIAQLSQLDNVLLVGSFIRKDQPLLAVRLRNAAKHGARINLVHSSDEDVLMPVHSKNIVKPSELPLVLARIAAAVARNKGVLAPVAVDITEQAQKAADSLCADGKNAIFMGQYALGHDNAVGIQALVQFIADQTGAHIGTLVQDANAVGAYALGLGGIQQPVNVLFNVEPLLDCKVLPTFASTVIAFSSYFSAVANFADVILPIVPNTESGGTLINLAGQVHTTYPSVKPLNDAKPAWKVLKVLAQELSGQVSPYETLDQVRDLALIAVGDLGAKLDNTAKVTATLIPNDAAKDSSLERLTYIGAYSHDAIVRRASSLQSTAQGAAPTARMNLETLTALNLQPGQAVTVRSAQGHAHLVAELDNQLPKSTVAIASAHLSTAALGDAVQISVEVA